MRKKRIIRAAITGFTFLTVVGLFSGLYADNTKDNVSKIFDQTPTPSKPGKPVSPE